MAHDEMELEERLDEVFRREDAALVERFLPGRPVLVGVLELVLPGMVEAPRSSSWVGPAGPRARELAPPAPCGSLRERRDSVPRRSNFPNAGISKGRRSGGALFQRALKP